ncbi:MAG: HAD hydrolase family protein, partial [Clostridia bacterium]|nr:HAD hydrolase family protein [Clostridia bacterium]
MKYQLIVSDFDGTFRHRDNTVGQKTVSAVQEYIRQGGKFAICTGRMPTSIRPVLQRLQLDGLYVAYQGSIVGEVQSGNFLRESGFTKEQALRICALMQGMGMRIHLYDRENCYVNYSDEYLKMYEEICHIQAVYVEDLYAFILNSSQKFFKLLAMVRKEERNQVRDTLRQKLGEDEFYISC